MHMKLNGFVEEEIKKMIEGQLTSYINSISEIEEYNPIAATIRKNPKSYFNKNNIGLYL